MRGYDEASYGDGMADVYDEWYAARFDTDSAVRTLIELAGPGPVLELGAGTGRLALPLARHGVSTHAVDASGVMLDRLRAKPGGGEVHTYLGDMSIALPPGPFTLAFVAVNTLFNLTHPDAQQATFHAVAQRLTPGGRFVVEAFVPDLGRDGDHVEIRDLAVDRIVLSISRSNGSTQRAEGQFVELTQAHGVRLRPWSIRWATVAQLDEMAALAGLTVERRWSSWAREPFGPDSDNHVTIYRTASREGADRVV